MALEVPTVATFHAGPTYFLTPNNSYPLTPLFTDPADGSAVPPVGALRDALREIYRHWKRAKSTATTATANHGPSVVGVGGAGGGGLHPRQRARNARQDISRRFAPTVVASAMVGRLNEIALGVGVGVGVGV